MNSLCSQKIVISFIAEFFIVIFQIVAAPEYGYLVSESEQCAVWWAEGAYKVMQADPIPSGKAEPVKIWSAKNEYESFQIVLNPYQVLNNLWIEVDDLKDKRGNRISQEHIVIKKADYVEVTEPTDYYGKVGWYPDPLPVLEHPVTLTESVNQPFWITIMVPESTTAGVYTGSLSLKADQWQTTIPVTLEVWNFSLPDHPSIRSSFGIDTELIEQFHNLDSEEELRTVTDKYFEVLRDYKIAPTSPFRLFPMDVTVEGQNWQGGIFTQDTVFSGKTSLRISDNSYNSTAEAYTGSFIEVNQEDPFILTWQVLTRKDSQEYSVLVKCYDGEKQYLPYQNKMEVYKGVKEWKPDTLSLDFSSKDIRYITIHLFPVYRDIIGGKTGTAWFDNVRFINTSNEENLVVQGDFEFELEDLNVNIDFSDFDYAARRYLDDFGFNAYNLHLKGLPSGNFFAQKLGVFHGFSQGSEPYEYLMQNYITAVQDHLEENGWLGKEYTYWFDEPNAENYPFVREGMWIIHRAAPKITRFITEHRPGPDIMDVTEISCTVIGHLDPELMKELTAQGREYWSYLCCCPKAPWLSLFIDHDAINLRMWLWITYQYQMKGILIWSANYWHSDVASPKDYLQNPWTDPMGYMRNFGTPWGKQNFWGNGDGRLLYPPNRNPNDHSIKYLDEPIPCVRLEILRDGIEDYEYLLLLEELLEREDTLRRKWLTKARKLLDFPDEMFISPKEYNKDPQYLINYRKEIGQLLHQMNSD